MDCVSALSRQGLHPLTSSSNRLLLHNWAVSTLNQGRKAAVLIVKPLICRCLMRNGAPGQSLEVKNETGENKDALAQGWKEPSSWMCQNSQNACFEKLQGIIDLKMTSMIFYLRHKAFPWECVPGYLHSSLVTELCSRKAYIRISNLQGEGERSESPRTHENTGFLWSFSSNFLYLPQTINWESLI